MAKLELFGALLLSSLSLIACTETFLIQGRVYCDTCRAGFETNITTYIPGARVKVECTHFATGKVEHTVDGSTDSTGSYEIRVEDDHEQEICEVVLVNSPIEDCKEVETGRDRAQVLLASTAGISGHTRHANSLGFLRNEPLPYCSKLLHEFYGLEA